MAAFDNTCFSQAMNLAGVYMTEEEVVMAVFDNTCFSQAMNLAGVYMTEEEVVNLLSEVDESGDGTIDFTEFRNTLLML